MKKTQRDSSATSKALRGVGNYAGLVLVCLGAFGFFFPFLCVLGLNKALPARLAWPLSSVNCIAVDHDGRIYCGLMSMGRIQQYSPTGDFIRGWQVDAGGGMYYMRVVSDRLHVQTVRNNVLYEFGLNGRYLSKRPSDDITSGFPDEPVAYADGTRYWVSTPELCPRLIKTDASGESTVVISVPAYLWPISGPVPGWLTGVAGMIVVGVTAKLRARRARSA